MSKAEKRGGLDFHSLARGTDKSYSTGYLVNLDQHTLGLVGHSFDKSNFDLGLTTLVTHTKRIFDQVESYSERAVEQFCFGSTYIQLNPNYRYYSPGIRDIMALREQLRGMISSLMYEKENMAKALLFDAEEYYLPPKF